MADWVSCRWMDGWTSRRRRSIVHFCDMWQCLSYLLMNSEFLGKMDCWAGSLCVCLACLPTSLPVHMMIDVVLLLLLTTVRSRDNLLLLLHFLSTVHDDNHHHKYRQSVSWWLGDHMGLMLIECENRLVGARGSENLC